MLNIRGQTLAKFLCKRPNNNYLGFVGQEAKLRLLYRYL